MAVWETPRGLEPRLAHSEEDRDFRGRSFRLRKSRPTRQTYGKRTTKGPIAGVVVRGGRIRRGGVRCRFLLKSASTRSSQIWMLTSMPCSGVSNLSFWSCQKVLDLSSSPHLKTGYEALKRATGNFHDVMPETVAAAVFETPISLIVLRCMLGFTPPEWAYYASRHTGIPVTQSAARTIDRNIRTKPEAALPRKGSVTERRIHALIAARLSYPRTRCPRGLSWQPAQVRQG